LPPGLVHAGYSWDEKRHQRLPISAEEEALPAIILRDFTSVEYYFDKSRKDLRLFATEHRIVRVNSSDGIERFNKIVVPVLESGAPVAIKARTISPRGEVREVKAADMKELKDQGGGRGFRVFAVDGVEKGSEVEYYYTRERPFNHFGSELLQSETAARDVTFELISPESLTFEARVYHGPAVTADTTRARYSVLRLALPRVPALREEAFANVQAQRMRVEYKLAYMASRGQVRQFTLGRCQPVRVPHHDGPDQGRREGRGQGAGRRQAAHGRPLARAHCRRRKLHQAQLQPGGRRQPQPKPDGGHPQRARRGLHSPDGGDLPHVGHRV
jgi:hypothetical protein